MPKHKTSMLCTLCSFCQDKNETVFHFDFDCPNNRSLWNQLHFYLAEDLALPPPHIPQATVFGFSKKESMEIVILCNHLFLIFKLYIYCSR